MPYIKSLQHNAHHDHVEVFYSQMTWPERWHKMNVHDTAFTMEIKSMYMCIIYSKYLRAGALLTLMIKNFQILQY